MIDLEHRQVPLAVAPTRVVLVDEGMQEFIKEFWRLGVKTQYSCEDNMGRAYVLTLGRTVLPVLKRMPIFKSGAREWTLMHFRGMENVVREQFSLGDLEEAEFIYERSYSKLYGHRITLRWPEDRTAALTALLKTLD